MWPELGAVLRGTCGPLGRTVRLPCWGALGPRPRWGHVGVVWSEVFIESGPEEA